MRANEFITEIFQPGKKNWEWVRKDNNYASASFSAGNRTYTWQAHSDNDGPTRWILEFRIQRELADPDKLDVWGKTGTGNSAEVMSTAVDITREFIKEYGDKISKLTFDAKEDSRIGLYAKMIARLLPEWELNQTFNKNFGMEFRLTNPNTNEFITESLQQTTLRQLYGGNYPDRDEEFWDYVSSSDFDKPLTIETMAKHKVLIMLLSQYRAEHIDDITDMLDDDQQAIVQSYTNDPALASKIIVVANNRIIDGNHRALAAAIKGVPINYVDLSELEEEPIDEAEVATKNSNEIWRQLRAAGYHHVGSGADATVFAKDDSHVIKILMPEDAGSKAEQVFRKFYDFSMARQDLACVPRFNEVNTIDINGKDYTQIEMEKLSSIPKGSFVEGLIWFLSHFTSSPEPWETMERELADPNTWKNYSPQYANAFAKVWQSLLENPASKKTYAMYKQLYTVMQILYNTGRINKFGWDLHTANVMLRQNGQPVIIDPWFSEGTS